MYIKLAIEIHLKRYKEVPDSMINICSGIETDRTAGAHVAYFHVRVSSSMVPFPGIDLSVSSTETTQDPGHCRPVPTTVSIGANMSLVKHPSYFPTRRGLYGNENNE